MTICASSVRGRSAPGAAGPENEHKDGFDRRRKLGASGGDRFESHRRRIAGLPGFGKKGKGNTVEEHLRTAAPGLRYHHRCYHRPTTTLRRAGRGSPMLKFFFSAAPNPMKVALFLEEALLAYEPIPVDGKRGDQHTAAFRAVNPNGKVPAILDDGHAVFDSNAILLYLAEKTGQFLPPERPGARGELLSWLMFVASGLGPFSGQAVHFRKFASETVPYAIKRYDFEARRHWQIIDDRLAGQPYMLGEHYTIVDMAVWGWGDRLTYMLADDDIMQKYPNLDRLMREIEARPAAIRARDLPRRHDFSTVMDEAAMRFMYPHQFAEDP
jgi:GST-like protein